MEIYELKLRAIARRIAGVLGTDIVAEAATRGAKLDAIPILINNLVICTAFWSTGKRLVCTDAAKLTALPGTMVATTWACCVFAG